jgi:cytochrome o ubiquinol oxidase subunit 3
MYLMTDFVLFASLFAVYAVLHTNTFGGPTGRELFSLPFVLLETIVLLTSSFFCGLAILAVRTGNVRYVVYALIVTALLGALFVGLEFSEFAKLVAAGNGWQRSGFLSSYFTLVGTHGLHVVFGILWSIVLLVMILRRGLTRFTLRKVLLFSMFWHFLDLVWIFIFTIVYLMGTL